jgi:hypothetical protein
MYEEHEGLEYPFDPEWHDDADRLLSDLKPEPARLDAYYILPGSKEKVWVPPGEYDVTAKPTELTYHKRGDSHWKKSDWGKREYEEFYNSTHEKKPANESSQEKEERLKRLKERRAKTREQKGEMLQAIAKNLDWIIQHDNFPENDMLGVLKANYVTTKINLDSVIHGKNAMIASLKEKHPKDKKARDKELHSQTTTFITHYQQDYTKVLNNINGMCVTYNVPIIVNTMPISHMVNGQPVTYAFPAMSFFSQILKQIKIIFFKAMEKRDLTHDKSALMYVNMFNHAEELRQGLHKDRYPKRLKDDLEDTAIFSAWKSHIRGLERTAFKHEHPRARVPKHLQENNGQHQNNGHHQGKGRRGGNGKGNGFSQIVFIQDDGRRGNRNNGRNGRSYRGGNGYSNYRRGYNNSYRRRDRSRSRSHSQGTRYTYPKRNDSGGYSQGSGGYGEGSGQGYGGYGEGSGQGYGEYSGGFPAGYNIFNQEEPPPAEDQNMVERVPGGRTQKMRNADAAVQSPRSRGMPTPAETDGSKLKRGSKFERDAIREARQQDRQDKKSESTDCALSDFLF